MIPRLLRDHRLSLVTGTASAAFLAAAALVHTHHGPELLVMVLLAWHAELFGHTSILVLGIKLPERGAKEAKDPEEV